MIKLNSGTRINNHMQRSVCTEIRTRDHGCKTCSREVSCWNGLLNYYYTIRLENLSKMTEGYYIALLFVNSQISAG